MTIWSYTLPDNIDQINVQDLEHYALRSVLQGMYLSPIAKPRAVLDIGCGRGQWIRDMATKYPKAQITGLDRAPLPEGDTLPNNCLFKQHDVLKGLPFDDDTFDLVYQRQMLFSIPSSNWPAHIKEMVRITQPAGWIECIEGDIRIYRAGPMTMKALEIIWKAYRRRGVDALKSTSIYPALQQERLIHLTASPLILPIGIWGGIIGIMMVRFFREMIQIVRMRVESYTNISVKEFDQLIFAALQECEANKSGFRFNTIYGQKRY
jgi:ubiquinone/menaquinone biosynthesis C-methylase UbiE